MVSVACSVLLFTSYSVSNAQVPNLDPTQVYSTGNLTTYSPAGSTTTSSWQNVGQWGGSLSCWGPGGPGYCGPLPYVNANGNNSINFSYGFTDLYQVVNIANALPNSGSGLRVNGFNFGFTAKNGNGWDNGQQDYLVAYVNLYKADNTLAQSYNYGSYTNQQYNWSTFNFSETFSTPYASKDLSTARYGFVGGDTNGWAGPYGPEITNVNFSLKYSVDPCFVDVLSSPTCPGYLEALAKLTPPTVTSIVEPTVSTSTPVITEISAPAVVSAASIPAASSSTSAATPKVGETQQSSSKASGPSLSTILGIVGAEQSRVSNLEKQTAQQAVQEAFQAGQQAQQQAESVASSLTTQSIASSVQTNAVSSSNSSLNTASISSTLMVPAPGSTSVVSLTQTIKSEEQQQIQTSVSDSTKNVVSSVKNIEDVIQKESSSLKTELPLPPKPQEFVQTNTATVNTVLPLPPKPQEFAQTNTAAISNAAPLLQRTATQETQTNGNVETASILPVVPVINISTNTPVNNSQLYAIAPVQPPSTGLKPTVRTPDAEVMVLQNEIKFGERNLILEQNSQKELTVQENQQIQSGPAVNRNTQNNDAAGSVNIENMIKQPQGFELYMAALKDTAFYAPKEIYKNQKVIDNQRVMRQLNQRSDRVFEEMVNEQYKK